MGDIFICHSKNDHDLVTFMNEICVTVGARAREYEFNYSTHDKTANKEIYKIMKGCSVLFVLLGANILNSHHTSNWVCSEIGLAKGMNIPIWVIEDWIKPINFPVPFLDHYARIYIGDPANRDPGHHNEMQKVVNEYKSRPACSGDINFMGTTLVLCNHKGCQAEFIIHQPVEDIDKCPVCQFHQQWKVEPQSLV